MTEPKQMNRPVGDLSSHVLAQIEEMLEAPAWYSGGRLPPEAELAIKFGVSRPVLRKALAYLRETGRIVSRRGSANFVQPKADVEARQHGVESLSIRTVFDMKRCMRFRQIVECGAAADAARLRDHARIAQIEAAQLRMLSLSAGESVFEADFAFHMAVAEATNNPYYTFALATMRSQIKLTVEFTRSLQGRPTDQVAPRVVDEHGAILDAIRAGDANAAQKAMQLHMKQTAMRLLEEELDGFSAMDDGLT